MQKALEKFRNFALTTGGKRVLSGLYGFVYPLIMNCSVEKLGPRFVLELQECRGNSLLLALIVPILVAKN